MSLVSKAVSFFLELNKASLENKVLKPIFVMKMQSPKMEQEEVEVERMGKKWPWMKAAQLMEFRMQTLVYRYIEAGLRVPHHLVVPIWNSLALSSSSNYNYHSSSRK